MTGSTGSSQASASETETNRGALRAGMASLGTPPERISLYGTLCLLKSVLNWDVAPDGGDSSGNRVGSQNLRWMEVSLSEQGRGEFESERGN